jgi:hypothetical protein
MKLSKRPAVYALPSYSLTGDLVGFLRCGLQYRYTRIGNLPSTRPVQAWFGQFVHGVLEEAYRRYNQARTEGHNDIPPWSDTRIEEICELIQRRLAAQNLFPWDEELEILGKMRAKVAINELGPELFPLIHRAEVRITGARSLPVSQIPEQYRFREADRYEMVGVIDVITHMQLHDPELRDNRLVSSILSALPENPPDEFEVIIDYKGMRRPSLHKSSVGPSFWDIYGWQAQTYAHLRSTQEDHLPIVAGIIIYLNELLPTKSDLLALRQEVRHGKTDVLPDTGGQAEQLLKTWREQDDPPQFPFDFRLQRALRVMPISPETIQEALTAFDDVVARIERCQGEELQSGQVVAIWEKNNEDESTCAACDARTFCPSYGKEKAPRLPGVKERR